MQQGLSARKPHNIKLSAATLPPQEPLWRMQQDRQHLFGGEQGEEDGEDSDGGKALPVPLANPQVRV